MCLGINSWKLNDIYIHQKSQPSLPQMTACHMLGAKPLSHLPLVLHICVSESGQHWFRQWLVAHSAPSHYLNQCWVIVNWTISMLRRTSQWNFNQNTKLLIHEKCIWNHRLRNGGHFVLGRWVILLTNADMLSTGKTGTNFSEPRIRIQLLNMKLSLKVLPAKRQSCCLSLNVLITEPS